MPHSQRLQALVAPPRMTMAAQALFVTMLLAPPPAWADKANEAVKLLDSGVELFKHDKLDEARTAFLKVKAMVPDKANPYRWLGLVEARLGHCKEALENLEVFIKRVPANDSRTVEAVTVRDRCKEELTVKTGTLIVESTPSAAEVRVDSDGGPALGVTPFRSDEIVVGSHVVNVKKDGFQPVSKVVSLGRGETVRLDVALQLEIAPIVASPNVPLPVVAPEPAPKKKSKAWILGVVGGVVAAGALGLGLGLGLTHAAAQEPVFPSVAAF